MRRLICTLSLISAMTALGCYSTTKIAGDTHTDPSTDTSTDPGTDPGPDVVPDVPPDTMPDILPDGTELCQEPHPPPYGPEVAWEVDGSSWPEHTEIFVNCTVNSITSEEAGHTVLVLMCMGPSGETERHWIDLWATPYLSMPLWEGAEVRFNYYADPIFWINRWFSLTWDSHDLVMGGIDADSPMPPIRMSFFGSVSIRAEGGYCAWEPDDCYDLERQALRISYPYVEDTLAFDSTTGFVGEWASFEYSVSEAVAYHNVRCTDVPPGWYTGLIVASMWD